MQKFSTIIFLSRFLLLVILNVAIDGVFTNVHALPVCVSEASDLSSPAAVSAFHHSHCLPPEQHHDSDDGDTCINCICHATLPVQTIQLVYNPLVIRLGFFEPFKLLPEVFLPGFIPPQNRA